MQNCFENHMRVPRYIEMLNFSDVEFELNVYYSL